MRFLKRNCLKYTQQCQNGIFKKSSPLNIMYTLKYEEFPNTNAHKHALQHCNSLHFKNRFVNANLN